MCETMKDQELILKLNFDHFDKTVVESVKTQMLRNGWIIKTSEADDDVRMTIYESEDDYKWKDFMCQTSAKSYNEAFKNCLQQIQEYYKRVL